MFLECVPIYSPKYPVHFSMRIYERKMYISDMKLEWGRYICNVRGIFSKPNREIGENLII